MSFYYKVVRTGETCSSSYAFGIRPKCSSGCPASCSEREICLMYGDYDIIQKYYSDKGIPIRIEALTVTHEDNESKSAPYSNRIWRYHYYKSIYIVADNHQQALRICKLHCIREGLQFRWDEGRKLDE